MKRKLTYLLTGALVGWALPNLLPPAKAAAYQALAAAGFHRGMVVIDGYLPPQRCHLARDGVTLACSTWGKRK